MKPHDLVLREWAMNEITFDFGYGVRTLTRQQVEEISAILRGVEQGPTYTWAPTKYDGQEPTDDGEPYYLLSGDLKAIERLTNEVRDLARSLKDTSILQPRNMIRCESLRELKKILEEGIPI